MNRRSFFGGLAAAFGSFFSRRARARTLPRGFTYVATEPEFIGRFPERELRPIIDFDPVSAPRAITFKNWENVGVGLIDTDDGAE